jgi:2-octaprenyl-6-methoxyphenol hydroxylase
MLAAYDRRRALDVRMRVAGVSMLNGVSMLGGQPFGMLRARGIEALHGIAPVRRGLMRLGLGAGSAPRP